MVRSQKKFILAFSMVSLSLSLVLIQTINKISFIVPVWRNWPSESNERKITSFISFSPKAFHFFFSPNPIQMFFSRFLLIFFFDSIICTMNICKSFVRSSMRSRTLLQEFFSTLLSAYSIFTSPSHRSLPFRSTLHCFRKLSTCFYILCPLNFQ